MHRPAPSLRRRNIRARPWGRNRGPAQVGPSPASRSDPANGRPAAAPLRRLCDAFRGLTVECNRKKGKGNTLEGTRRKRARVSGFRTRIASVGGAKVLAARRKKGRKVLVPASAPNHWNRMKK